MKTKLLFPLLVASALLTGCNVNVGASAATTIKIPDPDPATEIIAKDAATLSLAIVAAQKEVVVPDCLTLHEIVDTKEYANGVAVDQYVYDYTMNLDRKTGYYHTHLVQDSIEYNNTLARNLEYHYDINIHIWTDEAYRTTLAQHYVKYCEGVKVTDEKIYAVWNMGYYQDGTTKFGTGKFAALKDVLEHFFSGRADEGEDVKESDFGDYNVSHIEEKFIAKDEINDCYSASSKIASGGEYRPYTEAKNFKAKFYQDGLLNLRYDRSFDVAFTDAKYGRLEGKFEQSTKWTNAICEYLYDHRIFANNIYSMDQAVYDTYSTEEFAEDVPDCEKEGYVELNLNY